VGSINTEEAARRLARVILSDIELYHRERPKQGETLEAQIEEGRRLFASRVTPDLLAVFGLVLSDRARGSVNSPAAAEPPSTGASTAALGPDASPASDTTIQDQPTPAPSIAAHSAEDQPTPAPSIAAHSLEDQPTPAPAFAAPGASTTTALSLDDAPPASNTTIQDPPTPAPSIAAHSLEDQATPVPAFAAPGASTTTASSPGDAPPASNPTIEDPPTPAPSIAAPSLEDQPTPAPVFVAPPFVHQPALTARVPATPLAPQTPGVLAQARLAAPPAHELLIPVLTARFSIPRLLAIVSVVAATVAVLYHLVP